MIGECLSTYKLILWDFDGTLADTLPVSVRIFNEIARDYKLKEIESPEKVRSLSFRQFLSDYNISLLKLPGLVRRFLRRQKEHITEVALFPKIGSILTHIRTKAVPQGILSSNHQDNIRACLQHNDVEQLFEFVLGYPRLFGKAKMLRKLLRQYQLPSKEILYIGDEVRDIQAARKVAIPVAAVTWGFNEPGLLEVERPDFLVHTPEDLLGIVAR